MTIETSGIAAGLEKLNVKNLSLTGASVETPLLELRRLTKDFGAVCAVSDVSLSVAKGEFISLLGPSGCGKTTILQMIGGFIDPTSGSIRIDGNDLISVKPDKRNLGIVFQSYALFPHMTAAENIGFGLEMRGVAKAERQERVGRMLEIVGLAGLGHRYSARMSGGQQQRVALGRALVIEPRLLLLDEPLSNLDAKLREGMQVELRRIQQTLGTTTILVTHDQAEAMALSDRVVVMNLGCIEQIARPEDVYEFPNSEFVAGFLGKTNTLRATVRQNGVGALADFCELTVPLSLPVKDGVYKVFIRPERIRFAARGLAGVITYRVFQGNQWLVNVQTDLGSVDVVQGNSGGDIPGPSEEVFLDWGSNDMRLSLSET
jgi:putative spermidine/putrescine transport system ATP-binding protein